MRKMHSTQSVRLLAFIMTSAMVLSGCGSEKSQAGVQDGKENMTQETTVQAEMEDAGTTVEKEENKEMT